MKICLTGASGNLGRVTYQLLQSEGHEVAATDFTRRPGFELPVHVCNLVAREPIYEFVQGADAVVHLGNHPNPHRVDPQRLYTDNVAMNLHVFQAAMESGVPRLIFASSLQAMAYFDHFGRRCLREYDVLPVPSTMPGWPTNTYALSKTAGEQMLDYYVRMFAGLHACSLRFTELRDSNELSPLEYLERSWTHEKYPAEFFSFFSFQRAARLILALLERDPWEGHHVFQAAFKEPRFDLPLPELVRRFYPNAKLTMPVEEMDSLWEYRPLEEFAGWDASRHAHTVEDGELAAAVGLVPRR
ncbi:MAG: NAD(P)-dependent oxidoreductase [Verrucomicrobiota bacterium]